MSSFTNIAVNAEARLPLTKLQNKEPHCNQKVGEQPFWEWTKLRKIALRQIDKFIDLVPVVLRDEDLTAVNRMRVYCRRLEEVLDLIYVKPRPRHIKKLRRRLKLCRQTLGKLRNCDALLAAADNSIVSRGPDSEAWQALRAHLQSVRAQTAVKSLEKLGRVNLSVPYLRLKRDFAMGPEEIASSHENRTGVHPEVTVIYARIVRSLDRHWREFTDAVERSHHDPCEHVIHRMRIAAKRLRYLAEVMNKLHIAGTIDALNWLKTLQRTIGIWHDLEIMERVLCEVVRGKAFHADAIMASQVDHIIRHNREVKKASTKTFFQMTRHSRDYQLVKHWVSGVVALHASQITRH
jgi:CHAD domain-containing protein